MSMLSRQLCVWGLVGLLLTGCAVFEEVGNKLADSHGRADEAIAQQNQMRKSGAVVRMSAAKLAGEEISVKNAGQLPPAFSRSFSYLSAHQPLSAILGEIGRRTGIGTAIQPSDPSQSTNAPATAAPVVPGIPGLSGGPDAPIAVDWNGDLKGLLDYLATTTKMFWKYEDGRIYFFRTETRTFHIFLPAGKRNVKSSISLSGSGTSSGGTSGGTSGTSSSGASGSSGSGTGTVDVTSNMEIDAYDAIVKSVQAIVSTAEGTQSSAAAGASTSSGTSTGVTASSKNVVANPALGIITVTATPAILDRVASYVRSVNERFAQNVMIAVKIYELNVSKGVDVGASLSLAYANMANKALGGLPTTTIPGSPPAPGIAAIPAQVVPVKFMGAPNQMVLERLVGKFSGTQLLVKALETVGDVQFVTSGQVIAANGQPSPLQVARQISYVASRATSQAANVGTSATITPGQVTVGFTANFLPLILGDNRIMLQYQINLSSLLEMKDFGETDDNRIQLPNVQTQSLQQQAFVKDGQSIVLLGFEQERAELAKSNGLTQLGRRADSDRRIMVIVMEVFSGK